MNALLGALLAGLAILLAAAAGMVVVTAWWIHYRCQERKRARWQKLARRADYQVGGGGFDPRDVLACYLRATHGQNRQTPKARKSLK